MAIKGAVLGDILGAQYEFDRPKDLDWKNVPLLSDQGVGFTDDYEYSIAYSLDEIRPRYKWNESCQGSVPAAMRCFYESEDYESFIRNVSSLECDSDTFGAIAGGVAEEFYGGFGKIDAEALLKKYLTPELYEILMM